MQILLVKVPSLYLFESMRRTAERLFPLGLGYISSYVKSRGHQVTLLDPEMQGMSDHDLETLLQQSQPELVGLGSVTANFSRALSFARLVKQNTRAPVVYGGPHASALPEQIVERYPEFDVVVVGEGEQTMAELADAMHAGRLRPGTLKYIRGICYRDHGSVRMNPPRPPIAEIDALPFPDRGALDVPVKATGYLGLTDRVANMISSRGCPARCTFCQVSRTMGHQFRARSPANVISEIRDLQRRFGVKQVVFHDDTLNFSRQRVRALCRAFVDDNLDVRWMCWARVNTVQERETLQLMKAAGCVQINFGVETGDADILRSIKKGITIEQSRRAFGLCREVGIKTSAGFIIGFPGESRESVERTIRYAIELEPDVALFNTLVPLPGSELFAAFPELHDDHGDASHWDRFKTASSGGYPVAAVPGLDRDELRLKLVQANRRFYLRPRYLARQLRRVGSWYELKADVIGALELLHGNLKKIASRGARRIVDGRPREPASTVTGRF